MKILQLTRQFYPAVGGIPEVVKHLSQNLITLGHNVNVMALNHLFQGDRSLLPEKDVINGITVRRIPYWGPRNYAIAPSVLRFLDDFDLIHLHSSDFFLDYMALTKLFHHKPLVLNSHGMYFHTTFARVLKKIYFQTITRLSLKKVSAIVCDSNHDMELLSSIAPLKKLKFIPNGIDYDYLSNFSTQERDPDLILSVGILTSNKRYDRLLRVFALVHAERPAAKLIIVGPDRGLLYSLQELSCTLNIAKQVEFVGRVSDEELWGYLRRASVWVSSSEYESFGVALLEAMAAGCVPVVQPLLPFKQLLGEDLRHCYADFTKSPQASEMILKALALELEERQKITDLIRSRSAKYSWGSVASKFEDLYVKVLG